MSKLTIKKLGTCHVRSGTAHSCTRPAVVKLQGIPFCESCACEQETYFAIGEFTEAEESAGGESLAVVIDLVREIRLRQQIGPDPEPDAAA